jgi:hypothetical protein
VRFEISFLGLIVALSLSSAVRAQDSQYNWAPSLEPVQPNLKSLSLPRRSGNYEPNPVQKSRQNGEQKNSNDRILWTLPNYLTVENAENIPPLTPKQKFQLTSRGLFDPFEFVLVGFVAGLGQASDSDPSYGQGLRGYAKRYGTAYGDNFIENFMSDAVVPSVLHQDPRYYQLGHGSFLRRSWHAVSRVVITRSDSGQTQVNYSELIGASSAAAISTYTYHPQSERDFGQVVSVWGTQMAWDAATYMVKEFWPDLRKHSRRDKSDVAAPQPDGN